MISNKFTEEQIKGLYYSKELDILDKNLNMKNIYARLLEDYRENFREDIHVLINFYSKSMKMIHNYFINNSFDLNKRVFRLKDRRLYKQHTDEKNYLSVRDLFIKNSKGIFVPAKTSRDLFINFEDFSFYYYDVFRQCVNEMEVEIGTFKPISIEYNNLSESHLTACTNKNLRIINILKILIEMHKIYLMFYTKIRETSLLLNVNEAEGIPKNIKKNNSVEFFSFEAEEKSEFIDDEKEESSDNKKNEESTKKSDTEDKGGDGKKKSVVSKGKQLFNKTIAALKSVPKKIDVLIKKGRLFNSNRKNISLFQRHRGRIPTLYSNYASTAEIRENKMRGDPVKILNTVAADYVLEVGKNIGMLSDELQKMGEDLFAADTHEKKLQIVKAYTKDKPLRDKKGKSLNEKDYGKNLVLTTRRKIAQILLKGQTSIYGFNEDSMTVGKLPTPNHLMVSLFVENPYSNPEVQSVSDIFESADSFMIMCDCDKQKAFQIDGLASAILKNKIDTETFKKLQDDRRSYLSSKVSGAGMNQKQLKKVRKTQEKEMKKIKNGLNESIKLMGDMKVYMSECINVYFSLIMRIDDLVKKSLIQMIDVERQNVDRRYDGSVGAGKTTVVDPYNDDIEANNEKDRKMFYEKSL